MMMTVQFIVKAKLSFFQKPRKGKGTPKPAQPGCRMTSRRESDSGDLPGTDLIAEDAEAGSREFGRSAGDVLLQRGFEIDDGVGTELARFFLDDP